MSSEAIIRKLNLTLKKLRAITRSRNVNGYKSMTIEQLISLFTPRKNQIDVSVHNLFESPFTRYQLGLEE